MLELKVTVRRGCFPQSRYRSFAFYQLLHGELTNPGSGSCDYWQVARVRGDRLGDKLSHFNGHGTGNGALMSRYRGRLTGQLPSLLAACYYLVCK